MISPDTFNGPDNFVNFVKDFVNGFDFVNFVTFVNVDKFFT